MIRITRTNYAGTNTITLPDITLIADSHLDVQNQCRLVAIRAATGPLYPGPQPIIAQTPYLGVLVIDLVEDELVEE